MSTSKAIVRALALDKAITTLAGVRGGTRPEINARRRIFMQLIDAGPAGQTRSVLAGRKDYRIGAAQFDKLVAERHIEEAPWPPNADGRTKPRWRLSDWAIELLDAIGGPVPNHPAPDLARFDAFMKQRLNPEPEVETFWNQQPDLDPEPVSTHEDFWSQSDPEPDSTTESFWECHDPDCHDPDRPNLKSDDLEDCTR